MTRTYVELPSGKRCVVGGKVWEKHVKNGDIEGDIEEVRQQLAAAKIAEQSAQSVEQQQEQPAEGMLPPVDNVEVPAQPQQAPVQNAPVKGAPAVDGQGRELFESKTDAEAKKAQLDSSSPLPEEREWAVRKSRGQPTYFVENRKKRASKAEMLARKGSETPSESKAPADPAPAEPVVERSQSPDGGSIPPVEPAYSAEQMKAAAYLQSLKWDYRDPRLQAEYGVSTVGEVLDIVARILEAQLNGQNKEQETGDADITEEATSPTSVGGVQAAQPTAMLDKSSGGKSSAKTSGGGSVSWSAQSPGQRGPGYRGGYQPRF